jgi:hypothetical protein
MEMKTWHVVSCAVVVVRVPPKWSRDADNERIEDYLGAVTPEDEDQALAQATDE